MAFADLKLTRQFQRALEELSFRTPTEIQRRAIPKILAGHDVIGIAQTGTGKTAAFVLPLLQKLKGRQDGAPRVVILVPTKELALQVHLVVESLAAYTEIRSAALVGGVGPKHQIAVLDQGLEVVVSTPGRFMELYLRGALVTKRIHSMVLDEADRMMDMGFMPQLRNILEVIPRKRQNVLFSATFPKRVESLADEFLLWPTRVEVTPEGTPVASVSQHLVRVPNIQTKINLVLHWIRNDYQDSKMLVFVRTKQDATKLRQSLDTEFPGRAVEIHSNKGQHTRHAAMSKFRSGEARVLVSTDVSARGIDVPETEVVINFTVPRMSDDYVHRIGRTGRAERSGVALTLVDPTDEVHLQRMLDHLPGENRPVALEIPDQVDVPETPPWEAKSMAKTIDFQKRKADPTYQGAFHEKKNRSAKKSSKKKSSGRRRTR